MRLTILGVLAIAASLSAAGCSDLGVGRKCIPSSTVSGRQISAPALDCMSRLCYLSADNSMPPNVKSQYCTARCTTDDDCKGGLIGTDTGLCQSKFVCAVATQVDVMTSAQHFACQTLCLCQDDLVKGDNADTSTGAPCWPTSCSKMGGPPAGSGLQTCQ
jgi:hypothetical protein